MVIDPFISCGRGSHGDSMTMRGVEQTLVVGNHQRSATLSDWDRSDRLRHRLPNGPQRNTSPPGVGVVPVVRVRSSAFTTAPMKDRSCGKAANGRFLEYRI
jgi:hypothetical protein